MTQHAHTMLSGTIVSLSLPDRTGHYAVLRVWHCATCPYTFDLAYDQADNGQPLNDYATMHAAYRARQSQRRTRTVLRRIR